MVRIVAIPRSPIVDIIANKDLDKRRQPLLELSISGRHRRHYLWLLTHSYKGIPKKLREQSTVFITAFSAVYSIVK